MNTTHAKQMMDAFYEAKRIRDAMPPLPDGIRPSYINTLDAIFQLAQGGKPVRVSDVAEFQRLPRPAVTRTAREMGALGLIAKESDPSDRRVVHLLLTKEGENLYHTYVVDYFRALTEKLSGISDRDAEIMISTIHSVREALQ